MGNVTKTLPRGRACALGIRILMVLRNCWKASYTQPHILMSYIAPSWMLRYGSRDPRERPRGGDVFRLSIPLLVALIASEHVNADGSLIFGASCFLEANCFVSSGIDQIGTFLSMLNIGTIALAAFMTVGITAVIVYSKIKVRRTRSKLQKSLDPASPL